MTTVVVAVTLAAGVARAHVSPSVDDNNRYLKITPSADRLRVAYTVFFGEVPGAQQRPAMDGNHDKRIDEAEARAFGDKLSAEIAAAIDLTIDGHAAKIAWETVAVGMGTEAVAAGAFSVDVVGYLCLGPGSSHAVQLNDRFKLVRPGETEVRVEDSPGIAISRARIGPADDASHDYKFAGPAAPLSDDGLELAFTASDKAPRSGACRTTASAGSSTVPIVVGLGIAAVGIVAFLLWSRRRRATAG